MLVGLCYDLKDFYLKQGFSEEDVADFDSIEVIEAIETTLNELNFKTQRIGNIFELVDKLSKKNSWDLVFNISEGLYGTAREAQIPCLLDAYQIPYTFSSALTIALCHNKVTAKEIVSKNGIASPAFYEIKKLEELNNINLKYPLFAKPVAEGTSKGISNKSKVSNFDELKTTVSELLEKYKQPVLVETFLPGREFTIGVVGNGENTKVWGVMGVLFNSEAEKISYSYLNKKNYADNVIYRIEDSELGRECGNIALRAYKVLGCKDSARVDIRLDGSGIPNFLEVNPLAGLNPIDSDLAIMSTLQNIPYKELISNIMNACLKRLA